MNEKKLKKIILLLLIELVSLLIVLVASNLALSFKIAGSLMVGALCLTTKKQMNNIYNIIMKEKTEEEVNNNREYLNLNELINETNMKKQQKKKDNRLYTLESIALLLISIFCNGIVSLVPLILLFFKAAKSIYKDAMYDIDIGILEGLCDFVKTHSENNIIKIDKTKTTQSEYNFTRENKPNYSYQYNNKDRNTFTYNNNKSSISKKTRILNKKYY